MVLINRVLHHALPSFSFPSLFLHVFSLSLFPFKSAIVDQQLPVCLGLHLPIHQALRSRNLRALADAGHEAARDEFYCAWESWSTWLPPLVPPLAGHFPIHPSNGGDILEKWAKMRTHGIYNFKQLFLHRWSSLGDKSDTRLLIIL